MRTRSSRVNSRLTRFRSTANGCAGEETLGVPGHAICGKTQVERQAGPALRIDGISLYLADTREKLADFPDAFFSAASPARHIGACVTTTTPIKSARSPSSATTSRTL